MARETYEVRFDRHGHLIIEDVELARKILYLLQNGLPLELRMRSLDEAPRAEVQPINWRCPAPSPSPAPRNGSLCPNMMCDCGALRIVDEQKFQQQWSDLSPRREG